jgi:hypothetical protein
MNNKYENEKQINNIFLPCVPTTIIFSITCLLCTRMIFILGLLILKNAIIDKILTYALETSTLTKRDRKQLNIFERKVYRRILGPVYDNEKENRRILANEEIYVNIKKPTITETIRLHR